MKILIVLVLSFYMRYKLFDWSPKNFWEDFPGCSDGSRPNKQRFTLLTGLNLPMSHYVLYSYL